MPKILMLTTDQAIDRRILLEADALGADGWNVAILAMPGCASDDPRVIRAAEAEDGFANKARTVQRLYRLAREWLPTNGPWMSRLKSAVWCYLIRPDKLARMIMLPDAMRHSADVIVAHDLPILTTAIAAATHHGAKLVYDSHELYCEQDFAPRLRRLWSGIERGAIGACDVVITVNPSIARELKQRYGLAQVGIVHNAERADGPAPARGRLFHDAFGLEESAIVVLFQGGLVPGRNLETLIDAMVQVSSPATHLVFLGDGASAQHLAHRARTRGVSSRVHFHRAVAQRELLGYTASADLGIIPYQATCLNNLYCTPNKLFEFVAAAVPMLASDLPELRRLIAGNDIGLLIDTSSPQVIAQTIDALVARPDHLLRLRANVIEARRRLNWDEESKLLIDIYRRLRPT